MNIKLSTLLGLLFINLHLGFTEIPAAPSKFCYQHGSEIFEARSYAAESLLQCHKAGGKIYRDDGLFWSVRDIIRDELEYRNTYTAISEVFRDCQTRCKPEGLDHLLHGWQGTSIKFQKIYTDCIQKHGHLNSYYERGRIHFDNGRPEECVKDLKSFFEKGGASTTVSSDMRRIQGQALNELGEYDRAIPILSDLIEQNPQDKELYFQRAAAFFETGDYDDALRDFLASGQLNEVAKIKLETSQLFADGFLAGLTAGSQDALTDFIPSACMSAYGLGTSLWNHVQTPRESLNNFINASHEALFATFEYMQSTDKAELDNWLNECSAEFQRIMLSFDQMSDVEKGQTLGYLLGNCGTDVLTGAAALKAINAAKKLVNANRICNLETMASSTVNAERIAAEATRHNLTRSKFFRDVKINVDRQNKHVPGSHNYDPTRSNLLHPDAKVLLEGFAGTGQPNRGIPGCPGYRELVDFGESIGYHVDKVTGKKTATTWGEIHYAKTGAHIVPILPRKPL